MELKTLDKYPRQGPARELAFMIARYNTLPDDNEAIVKTFDIIGLFEHYDTLRHRLEWVGILTQIDRRILITVCAFCETPGVALLWAHTLRKFWETHHYEGRLTWPIFHGIFGCMFPTEHGYRMAWEDQKVGEIDYLKTEGAWA